VFLNRIIEVREMTRRSPRVERRAVTASVMPSTKYSCCGSFEKFARGRTAMDRIGVTAVVGREAVVTASIEQRRELSQSGLPSRSRSAALRNGKSRCRRGSPSSVPASRYRAQPRRRRATTLGCVDGGERGAPPGVPIAGQCARRVPSTRRFPSTTRDDVRANGRTNRTAPETPQRVGIVVPQ
jgi:hypothetical protein